jgi:hypothetical protein
MFLLSKVGYEDFNVLGIFDTYKEAGICMKKSIQSEEYLVAHDWLIYNLELNKFYNRKYEDIRVSGERIQRLNRR